MAMKKLLSALRAYRWPLFLMSLLVMSISAHGILVCVATRPNAPRPIAGFYERSQQWDSDSAERAASKQLGWKVDFSIPAGQQYLTGMPRPVDVAITDRDGQAVSGLAGKLLAKRPSDQRLNARGELYELPHAPGRYRSLVRLAAPGVWELSVDARLGKLHFVHSDRVDVATAAPKKEATE